MVPLVPKLAVMTPCRVLPVPTAPIMLSPPPALTSTSPVKPSALAAAGCRDPTGRSLEINGGSLSRSPASIARSASSDHWRVLTSSNAVPLASPYSMTFWPVSQKLR